MQVIGIILAGCERRATNSTVVNKVNKSGDQSGCEGGQHSSDNQDDGRETKITRYKHTV